MICTIPGCEEHYACVQRAKELQVSPKATPNRKANRPQPFRPAVADQWGKADAVDDRGIRIVRPNGTPYSLKEYSEQRHRINDIHAAADAGRITTTKKD